MGRSARTNAVVFCKLLAGAATLCCAGGCLFGGREPSVITSNDPGSKIPAIKRAATEPRDTETARQLVKSLGSDDPAIRFYAIRGLQTLTGETFGYVWYADEPERRGSMDKWKQWIETGAGGSLAGAEPSGK